ncbi:FAD-linked oxidoreductase [Xylanimonas oleitrophica]|uniref:FAD-linked oxidoreductase n=1 Tax=Xylanimonas oleitrophica TaxID=2607479 RepID=A0A2W5WK36_9MICO|nr:D-arabinono-1,4-lactone oxidase [Xylanimonas oleitrophica]PZR51617.1 FAD-linked oxidoreductase [Xylanimonas oleitrophica]
MPVTDARDTPAWENWGRTVASTPARRARPRDEAEVAAEVARAAQDGLRVRAVGSGHSFTAAAATDGLHLELDLLAGVEAVERRHDGTARVTVRAGTRLYHLHHLLAAHGLALTNLGDIDRQTIAGAISTGTHGTGVRFGGMASQVSGVRVVTPDGEVLTAGADDPPGSARRELFEVARLGLGSVGVLTAVTLETVPAFWLRARDEPWALARVLEDVDAFATSADHAELFWFPGTHRALTFRNDRLSADEAARWGTDQSGLKGRLRLLRQEARGLVDDELLSNGLFELVNRVATAAPGLTAGLNRFSARALPAREHVAPSHEVFSHKRRVRFREMEYAIPRAAVRDVVRELDVWLRRSSEAVPFPVELRFAAPDDVWLSTARDRETAYVAVHQYVRMSHRRWFDAAERILVAADGRPHWGKLHSRTAEDLAAHYPLQDVARVRAAVDPGGVFANGYVDTVLGAPGAPSRPSSSRSRSGSST